MTELPHISVLLDEVVEAFSGANLRIFVDATLGAGGHTLKILEEHPEIERVIGIDQDPQARALAAERLKKYADKVTIVPGNFSDLASYLEKLDITEVDGILMDLGISSMQVDQGERGFSFNKEGPLDMRMNPEQELSAETIVNNWDERELCEIFRTYGEERRARRAAQAIVQARKQAPITRTLHLVEILQPIVGRPQKGKAHPVTKIFQALRIAVNAELDVLRSVLPDALNFLRPQGRLAIISFHSLEDRIVKRFFSEEASDKVSTSGVGGLFLDKVPTVRLLTRKAVVATNEELERNPRSRSARLRVVEKL